MILPEKKILVYKSAFAGSIINSMKTQQFIACPAEHFDFRAALREGTEIELWFRLWIMILSSQVRG